MSNLKEKDDPEIQNSKEDSDSASSDVLPAPVTDKDMNQKQLPVASRLIQPHTAGQDLGSERHYTIEEETTTVHIPMFRPKLAFLDILREAGAQSEVFTIKEIVHHVKDYIIMHQLFDKVEPSIVHCGHDKLGKVFQVSSFTVNDAVNLFLKNSTPVPDTCVRIRRQLVKRAINPNNAGSNPNNTTVTASSSSSSAMKISALNSTDMKRSTSSTITSGYCPIITSTTFPEASHARTPCDSNKENCGASSQHKGNSLAEPASELSTHRKRHHSSTSLNVSYGDEVDGESPCCFQVNMETKAKISDDVPQGSSQPSIEEDCISVQYDSDEFSLEYEVESSDHRSESDISSRGSGKDIVLVCKESDVEFWADYSDTENSTDTELSIADLWVCEACETENIPYHSHCSKCWNLRFGWLPEKYRRPPGSVLPSVYSHRLQSQGTFSSESNDETTTQGSSAHMRGKKRRVVRVVSASSSGQNSDSLVSDENLPDTSNCGNSLEIQGDSGLSSVALTSSQEAERQTPGRSQGEGLNKGKGSRWHRGLGLDLDAVAPASDVCVVCASRPKIGSIIHGNSGHQVCCYRCAKRLKRKGLPCPVCRKPIQKVIKNFIL